jgi:hypothetical protein
MACRGGSQLGRKQQQGLFDLFWGVNMKPIKNCRLLIVGCRLLLTCSIVLACMGGITFGTTELRQSTTVTVKVGPFTDITDGTTRKTALVITQGSVWLSKAGLGMATKNDATSATHDGLGVYFCPLNVTDTGTAGPLRIDINDINAVPVWAEFMVLDQNAYDAKYAGASPDVNTVAIHKELFTDPNNKLTTDPNGHVKLAADGLDLIPITDPNGVATTYPQMQVQTWRRFFKKTARTLTKIYTFNDFNTAETTQDWSDSGGVQMTGTATGP